MTEPYNFNLNTNYPLDKVIIFKEQTVSAGSLGSGTHVSITHGLGFTPLIFGVWSYTSDFTASLSIASGRKDTSEGYLWVYSNSTTIELYNYTTSTVYVRLYGFEPSTSATTIAKTNTSSGGLLFNSDWNYAKLYLAARVQGNGDLTSGTSVYHNLGFVPQVMAWVQYTQTGNCEQAQDSFILGTSSYKNGVEVDSSKVTIYGTTSQYYHLRIYADV